MNTESVPYALNLADEHNLHITKHYTDLSPYGCIDEFRYCVRRAYPFGRIKIHPRKRPQPYLVSRLRTKDGHEFSSTSKTCAELFSAAPNRFNGVQLN